MIQHAAMIGWPLRDPTRYRFPLPNRVWSHKLRPVELVVLAYLCYRKERELSPKEIARGARLSVTAVRKHLPALMSKEIISAKSDGGNFFTLPNEVFLLELPPTSFMVYAYLLTCEKRRTHQCHPSYRTMVTVTGLSSNTVMKAVTTLVDKQLITAKYSHWFNERGMKMRGNNVYTVLPIQFAVDMFHQRQLSKVGCPA